MLDSGLGAMEWEPGDCSRWIGREGYYRNEPRVLVRWQMDLVDMQRCIVQEHSGGAGT